MLCVLVDAHILLHKLSPACSVHSWLCLPVPARWQVNQLPLQKLLHLSVDCTGLWHYASMTQMLWQSMGGEFVPAMTKTL